ncbi:Mom family adenine methylcarbamoylation protein [Streptomyces sp. 6N106]|uniref:Mom family adenine methylcarbamoylation protein n=1 Tax=Streptomyces sp. 6N106 TaxID=3457418 RepID=UPI003FCFC065
MSPSVIGGWDSTAMERPQVRPMSAKDARDMAEKFHYLHRKPQVSHAFGLYVGCDAVGVVTYGTPASRHLQMGVCPSNPSLVTELNRLWVSDEMPPNTESWFVSRTLRALPPRIVVSYADTTMNHMGYVYRALNFKYAGWTDMERRTARYDYIPITEGAHTREAFRSGVKERVRRKPKVKYWTTTGTRAERRTLAALCGWVSMDWKTVPPPTAHRQYLLAEREVTE